LFVAFKKTELKKGFSIMFYRVGKNVISFSINWNIIVGTAFVFDKISCSTYGGYILLLSATSS